MVDQIQAVKDGFSRQGFMETLGATLTKAIPGHVEITVPYSKGLTQQHGFFHGGVAATLADNAAGFAAQTVMDEGRQPLTIEFKINYLAPAQGPTQGEALVARADVLRAGRSLVHLKADVFARDKSGDETTIATALLTIKATSAVAMV